MKRQCRKDSRQLEWLPWHGEKGSGEKKVTVMVGFVNWTGSTINLGDTALCNACDDISREGWLSGADPILKWRAPSDRSRVKESYKENVELSASEASLSGMLLCSADIRLQLRDPSYVNWPSTTLGCFRPLALMGGQFLEWNGFLFSASPAFIVIVGLSAPVLWASKSSSIWGYMFGREWEHVHASTCLHTLARTHTHLVLFLYSAPLKTMTLWRIYPQRKWL